MKETQTPGGKYEHQVIWPPADSLSISDVSRRQSGTNACWEAAVTRRGTALGIITWSWYSGAHIKAEHAGHPVFFLFSLVLFFTPRTNNLRSYTALADSHHVSPRPWELSWLASTSAGSGLQSSPRPLAGCACPARVWYGYKLQKILFPISWEWRPPKMGWILDLT